MPWVTWNSASVRTTGHARQLSPQDRADPAPRSFPPIGGLPLAYAENPVTPYYLGIPGSGCSTGRSGSVEVAACNAALDAHLAIAAATPMTPPLPGMFLNKSPNPRIPGHCRHVGLSPNMGNPAKRHLDMTLVTSIRVPPEGGRPIAPHRPIIYAGRPATEIADYMKLRLGTLRVPITPGAALCRPIKNGERRAQ